MRESKTYKVVRFVIMIALTLSIALNVYLYESLFY
ncbi:hypothetical protein HEHE104102_08470 [Helicobacter hepaticus]|uniref:Uncharacterized protein n=1 Tax=Helicobacter hepaticus (strain ATCC 51449 / 3B1) TaxID=235279 RepID=Q7VI42_HELHP|nr:hypothetical protein HH_0766 [Helicobacter hepaticus ATCC 51449]